jgi:hypothetical protein
LGCGVRRDILSSSHPLEDVHRRGFGRGLRYLEAVVHICVDGDQNETASGTSAKLKKQVESDLPARLLTVKSAKKYSKVLAGMGLTSH